MPSNSKNKILIVATLLAVLTVVAVIVYLYSRPLPGPSTGRAPGLLYLLPVLPADAPVLAYVDVSALKASSNPSLQALGNLIMPGPQQDPDYLEFVRDTGFDFTRDLEHAAVAFWPGNFGESNH